jgi:hypothetical protein
VIWAVALLSSVAAGPAVLAVIITPVVVLGVLTSWRNARRVGAPVRGKAAAPGAAGTATLLTPGPQLWALLVLGLTPLAALGGIVGVLVFLLVGAGWTARLSMGASGRPAVPSTLAAVAPAVAGGFVVLAARQGTELVVVLVIAVLLFDVANAVMGTGSTGGILGAVSGLITVMVFSVMVNALLEPPFTGSSSWLLCGVVAVIGPLGVAACGRLVPRRTPALRRLDSLVLVAPVWWLATIVLLGR